MTQASGSTDFDVTIVGAGPVGLALAKGLSRDGRSVLILEKKPGLSEHSKAATVWPGTQEVLQRLGCLAAFEKQSLVQERLSLWDADRSQPQPQPLITFPLGELRHETKFPRLLVIPQNETERLLFESLRAEAKAKVEFSASATSLKEEDQRVVIEYVKHGKSQKVSSRFVVGCDGAHSFVRQAMGAHLEGETYLVKAGLADVRVKMPAGFSTPRLSTKNGLRVAIQIGQDFFRIILIEKADLNWDLEKVVTQAVEDLFHQKEYESVWTSEFKLHRRTSEFFAKGNAVLAGDAAHLNSPVGGQGMNAGIQDTESLRAALAKALAQNSNVPLLEYAKIRKAEIEAGVNKNTGRISSILFFNHGKYVRALIPVFAALLRVRRIRHSALRKIAMLPPIQEAHI